MAKYYMTRYLIDGYILADAFRPKPGWGEKSFLVPAENLPAHTDQDIINAAMTGGPPGYWLQRVDAIGGDPHTRTITAKEVPWGRSETPNVAANRIDPVRRGNSG